MPIVSQNDNKIEELEISETEFHQFVIRHQLLNDVTTIVPESNAQMKGSYAMVDPAGRFFNNITDSYRYSKPILDIGVKRAIEEINYNYLKFVNRGGIYEWNKIPNPVSKVG